MPPVPKTRSAKPDRNRNLLIAIAGAGLIALALIVGSILLTGGKGGDKTSPAGSATSPVALVAGIPQNGTVLGDPKAPVRMVQYEDFQCPYCGLYTTDALPAIVDEYVRAGRVKLDFRGVAFLGPDSEKALRVALAASRQNKFWQVSGLLYEKQGQENAGWVTDTLIDEILAQVPGLDAAKVKADATGAAVTKQVADINADWKARGVNGTPSFFIGIGTKPLYPIQVTSLTPDAFRPALDDALKG